MNLKATLAVAGVFVGCCSNVIFLELLVKEDPGCGNLLTFLQFLFIALHGIVFTSKFGTVKRQISMRDYVTLVVCFFLTSVLNNYAFDFNIPMPLHMIFRAGSLMANMIMGIIILKKQYTPLKYLSVIMITAGIVICTIQSGTEVKAHGSENRTAEEDAALRPMDIFWWTVGILILTCALFLSARLGIFQETINKKYGKHPYELLLYTHMLPLPFFGFLWSNLWQHWQISGESAPIGLLFGLPAIRVYLAANVLTQFLCISSVFILTTECASLTVTLTVTLRKFVSLIFSIIYFRNPFTIAHWIGTLLVFFGTMIFTELLQKIVAALLPKPEKKQD